MTDSRKTNCGHSSTRLSKNERPNAALGIGDRESEIGNRESAILVGTNIAGFQPQNILYVASFGDQYAYTSSETMSQLTQGTTRVIGYQGVAHGVQLLDDQTAWNDILNWLKANL